jgi:adenosylcobinamide amidohydrolase
MNYRKTVMLLAAIFLWAMPIGARDNDRHEGPERKFRAELKGRNEVPLVLSAARGALSLEVNETDSSVHFVLEYDGLQTTVLFAHIHVAQPDVNGAVTVFFCGGGGRPACPQNGTVEGDFGASNVLPIVTQQLEAANLAKLLEAIRAGKTYANVHSTTSPGGEIRGQIHDDDKDKDKDKDKD